MGSGVSCSKPNASHVVDSKPNKLSSLDSFIDVEQTDKMYKNRNQETRLLRISAETDEENKQRCLKVASVNENDDSDSDEIDNDDDMEKDTDDEFNEDDKTKEKKGPMTPEELKEFKEKKFEFLKMTVNEIMAVKTYRSHDGEYDVTIRNGLLRFYNSYLSLKRGSIAERKPYRKVIAQIMMETNILELLCEVIMETFKSGWWDAEGKKNDKKYGPMYKALLTIMNFSDASDEFAIAIADRYGFLEFIKEVLNNYRERFVDNAEPELKGTERKVIKALLSIVHNMTMRESNIKRHRDCDMINVLRPYLKSSDPMCSMNVLASLAGIIDEEECEIISGNKDMVLFLLDILRRSMKSNTRRHKGWSATESGFTVRMLARNDANKKLLVDLGALELLVKLGRTGNQEEQCESVQAIWALAFDADNAALITGKPDLGVVELLVDLKQSEKLEIKKACNGALWTLRDALKTTVVEKYKQIGETLSNQAHRQTSGIKARRQKVSASGHIMISYQWDDQATLKRIRDAIKEHGYKVWMDIDQMGGSTLQAMADAVEGADIFLMSMSKKYKNSPACRAEAEYAYQLRKKIIPLKMERGYAPDGWLGFILGSKLFFEFSDKYPFEQKMPALLKEIDSVSGAPAQETPSTENIKKPEETAGTTIPTDNHPSKAIDHPDSNASLTNARSDRPTVAMTTIAKVRKWTSKDVKDWIERTQLHNCGVENLTGGEVAFLAVMWNESADLIYRCLRKMLNVKDFLRLSKIVWALQDL